MGEFAFFVFGTVAFGAVSLLCCILFEQFGRREPIGWRERVPGFLMACTGTVASIFLIWPVSLVWDALGIGAQVRLPLWQWLQPLGWAGTALHFLFLAMLADFLIYWRHRLEHRLFWRIHAVHHSPRKLHAANDIAHPLQIFFNFAMVTIPLSLIEIGGPALPSAVALLIGLASICIHSPVALHAGPLRRLIVDNRFHRIHHSLEERHFDKNFGICFSCWDYLFGTAYEPGEEWPPVGLSDTPPPATITEYLLMPFRPARTSTAATQEEFTFSSSLEASPITMVGERTHG